MKRREFLNAAAVTASGAMLLSRANDVFAQAAAQKGIAGAQGATPPTPKLTFKTRPAKVEILFKAPGLSGNGMQVTDEGIWTIDIAGSRGDTPGRCKVYLSSFDGKLIRELAPEGTGPSGLGHDGKSIWIGSTYSREIIRSDAKTGETMEKHFTPGAGVIYDVRPTLRRARIHTGRRFALRPRRHAARRYPRGEAEAAGEVAARLSRVRTRDKARVMVSVSDAAVRSQAIPDHQRRERVRTAFRRKAASCGLPFLRAA